MSQHRIRQRKLTPEAVEERIKQYELGMLQRFTAELGSEERGKDAMKCWAEELPALYLAAYFEGRSADDVDSEELFREIVARLRS